MTKGELMQKVYSKAELSNIDTAIPISYSKKLNFRIHVMNYNNSAMGDLQNIYKIASFRNIDLDYSNEYSKCVESDEYFYNNYCWSEGMQFYTPEVFEKYINTSKDLRHFDFKDHAEASFKLYPKTYEQALKNQKLKS